MTKREKMIVENFLMSLSPNQEENLWNAEQDIKLYKLSEEAIEALINGIHNQKLN